MRRWIEDNQGTQILGIRWLVKEDRRAGKLAHSLVIYLKDKVNINQGVRMRRKIFRTTTYHWEDRHCFHLCYASTRALFLPELYVMR